MTRKEVIDCFATFVATEEGFFKPGSLPQRHNNPGDLTRWGDWPIQDGYVVFDTPDAGWKALRSQIQKNIARGLTFFTFFAGQRDADGKVLPNGYPGFCPAPTGGKMTKGNNPQKYAADGVAWVNSKLGTAATIDTVIDSLITE